MSVNFADFIGMNIESFLRLEPFREWPQRRLAENDIDEPNVSYEFEDNGLTLTCYSDGRIGVVFLFADKFDERLSACKFSWSRSEARQHFGTPSKVRSKLNHKILGAFGEADIFLVPNAEIHIEYGAKSEQIKQFTFSERKDN
jgi:hypothetical protein